MAILNVTFSKFTWGRSLIIKCAPLHISITLNLQWNRSSNTVDVVFPYYDNNYDIIIEKKWMWTYWLLIGWRQIWMPAGFKQTKWLEKSDILYVNREKSVISPEDRADIFIKNNKGKLFFFYIIKESFTMRSITRLKNTTSKLLQLNLVILKCVNVTFLFVF